MEHLTVEIDGRALDAIVSGPEMGLPLVFHHGTPMSNVQFTPFVDAAAERGLRTITYSRPGYGASTRHEGRNVADAASDTAAILDALGSDRCVSLGWSGGGPHALACAALLPDRVAACATIASVGPLDVEDLDFLAGMGEANVEEFGYVIAGDDDASIRFLQAYVEETRDATPEGVIESLRSLLPPIDVEAIRDDLGWFFVESDEEAFRNGIWGWLDDDKAFASPWGFDLVAIQVPVTIWQGEQDLMVPIAHGRWLTSRIPGARAELSAEDGHISLAVGRFGDILDGLVAQAAPLRE
ncbi:MAG: alpha/beta hydrolase [Actinomycetota bacterium]|nr:alpha/beta hydrolase [Actinomycetota bacterium]